MNHISFRSKAFLIAGILYCSFLAISSCGKKKSTEPGNPIIDFNAEILPILQSRCNTSGCHGGQTAADTAGGLVFSSFDAMRQTVGQKTSWTKPLIIPGNPDSSHLVLNIRKLRPSFMPPDTSPPLSQVQINKIADWVKQGAKGPGGKKFPTYREGKLYVANSADGRVDVIDLSMNYKVDSIPTTLPGENPTIAQTHHIAVSPDKKFIYVTNAWAFGHIIKIDAEADSVITRVRAGYQPSDIVISPDGQFVFTTDYTIGTNLTYSVVRRFNTQTLTMTDTFLVGRAPHGVAISKNGDLVLAPAELSSDCWFIYPDGDSTFRLKLWPGAVNPAIGVDSTYRPFGIIFSKTDTLAFISCIKNHQIKIVNTSSRSSNIDSIILDPVAGKNPFMLALTADGNTLYAACWGSNTIAVVDLPSGTISGYVPVGQLPHAPALVADSLLYVTCEGNHVTPYKVYVVNTITKTVVDSIDVGRYPNGVAVLKP